MRNNIIRQTILFYRDGFRSMTLGRTLWKIIFIKLFIMFAVLKFFFFPDYLESRYATDAERGNHVLAELTQAINKNSL